LTSLLGITELMGDKSCQLFLPVRIFRHLLDDGVDLGVGNIGIGLANGVCRPCCRVAGHCVRILVQPEIHRHVALGAYILILVLGRTPGRHRLQDAEGLLVEGGVGTVDQIEVGQCAIFFNNKGVDNQPLCVSFNGIGRITERLGDELVHFARSSGKEGGNVGVFDDSPLVGWRWLKLSTAGRKK
jgi:hypothetical protein